MACRRRPGADFCVNDARLTRSNVKIFNIQPGLFVLGQPTHVRIPQLIILPQDHEN